MTYEERETPAYTFTDRADSADHVDYIEASEDILDYSC